MRWSLWAPQFPCVLRIDGRGVQVAVGIDGQLVNVYGNILDPLDHRTGVFIQNRKVTHLIAGVNLPVVAGQAQRCDVGPLIKIGPVS